MKTKSQFVLSSLLLCSAFNPTHSLFAQGSLAPPGAPAPMFRTLEEVQPRRPIGTNTTPGDTNALFVISQPGSYYLTTNITGVAGKHGILITASGVTLDLMGFELVGVSNAFTTFGGIYASIAVSNIVVRNGTVRNWFDGVGLAETRNSQCKDLCVSDNRASGFDGGFGSTLVNCVARGNRAVGIVTRGGSVVSGCSVSFNGSDGIFSFGYATIIGCTATDNSGSGISAQSHSLVSGCSAGNNRNGILVAGNCTVVSCVSAGNKFDGINAQTQCNVIGCTANENKHNGISVSGACRVADNVCCGNGLDPVNGGSGILVYSQGKNRIENNHVVDNVTAGIRVAEENANRNLIMRNSASGNGTNYVLVAGNRVGPIVVPPSSADISGNLGGAGVGTTDPWANFAY